jgi:hypothetical protein
VTLTILREILGEHHVFQEGKFGGSIPGNSSQRLCVQVHSNLHTLRKRLREPNTCKAGVTGEVIDTLLRPFENLFTKFDFCCKIAGRTNRRRDRNFQRDGCRVRHYLARAFRFGPPEGALP